MSVKAQSVSALSHLTMSVRIRIGRVDFYFVTVSRNGTLPPYSGSNRFGCASRTTLRMLDMVRRDTLKKNGAEHYSALVVQWPGHKILNLQGENQCIINKFFFLSPF